MSAAHSPLASLSRSAACVGGDRNEPLLVIALPTTPTGDDFEDFIAAALRALGYRGVRTVRASAVVASSAADRVLLRQFGLTCRHWSRRPREFVQVPLTCPEHGWVAFDTPRPMGALLYLPVAWTSAVARRSDQRRGEDRTSALNCLITMILNEPQTYAIDIVPFASCPFTDVQ